LKSAVPEKKGNILQEAKLQGKKLAKSSKMGHQGGRPKGGMAHGKKILIVFETVES